MAGNDVRIPAAAGGEADTSAALANPFGSFEPATHPGVPMQAAPVETPAPVDTPAPAPDPLAVTNDPVANQGPTVPLGNDPPGTTYGPNGIPGEGPDEVNVMDPPVEMPGLKMGLQGLGAMGGGVVGFGAGGGVASIPGTAVGAAVGTAAGTAVYDVVQNIMDAVTGTKNSQGEPITLSQQTLDMLSNGFISAGGEVSQALSKTLMTGIKSQLTKSAIRIGSGGAGVALATLTGDQAAALGKVWGLIPQDQRTPDMRQALEDAVVNGGVDMIVNTALHSTLPAKMAARGLAHLAFGIDQAAVDASVLAAQYGLKVTMNNMSPGTMAKIFRNITTIVPLIGKPYRDLFNHNSNVINDYAEDVVPRLTTGTAPVTTTQAGQDAAVIANETYKKFLGVYNTRKDELIAKGRTAGVTFNSDSKLGIDQDGNKVMGLRSWGNNILRRVQAANTPAMQRGLIAPALSRGKTNLGSVNKDVLALAQKAAGLPQYVNLQQLDGLMAEVDNIATKNKGNQAVLDQLKGVDDSIQSSLTDSTAPGKSFPAIGEMFIDLQKEVAATRNAFKTNTGKLLLANASPGTIGDAIFAMNDPAQVEHLRTMIGDAGLERGTAAFMERAVNENTTGIGAQKRFDVDKFAKTLGLDNPSGNRFLAVQAALSKSDIKMSEVQKFVTSAKLALQNPPLNVATMIARKATLGGFRSALGVIIPGMGAFLGHSFLGAGIGEVPTVLTLLTGWKGAKIMSNPAYLQDMNTYLDHSAGLTERRMAIIRLAQAILPNDISQRATSPITDPNQQRGASGKFPPPHSGFLQQMFQ